MQLEYHVVCLSLRDEILLDNEHVDAKDMTMGIAKCECFLYEQKLSVRDADALDILSERERERPRLLRPRDHRGVDWVSISLSISMRRYRSSSDAVKNMPSSVTSQIVVKERKS